MGEETEKIKKEEEEEEEEEEVVVISRFHRGLDLIKRLAIFYTF